MNALEPKRASFNHSHLPKQKILYQPMKEMHLENMRHRYNEICPPLFKDTDPKRLPQDKLSQVLAYEHKPKGKGLVLAGDTGQGKTRAAWILINRLLCEEGVPVRFLSDPMFSIEYSKRLGNGTADEWMDALCRVAVLFIDDFGKAAITPRYKEQFYTIINERCNHYRPTILTTQWSKSKLIERFGDDDGKAIARRILEFSEIVKF